MRFHRFAAFLVLTGAAPLAVGAENPQPAPPIAIQEDVETVNAQEEAVAEDEASQSSGFVRVWYFGKPDSPRVTIRRKGDGGGGDGQVLGSAIRAGRMQSYREVPPGTQTFEVLPGSVVPDSEGRIPSGGTVLGTAEIELEAGDFRTLVVVRSEGGFEVSQLEDELPKKNQPGPIVRILDFSSPGDKGIWLGDESSEAMIWNSSQGASERLTNLPGAGPHFFQLRAPVNGSMTDVSLYEMTLDPRSAGSLVVFDDRYGRLTMQGVRDAVR